MSKAATYTGVDNEVLGGMTTIGKVVRDAWVFGLIPESETCRGWSLARIDGLLQQVNTEWDKYGCLVSQLPDELFERHGRIHGAAISRARPLAGVVNWKPMTMLNFTDSHEGSVMSTNTVDPNQYVIKKAPYYEPVGKEVALYEAAYQARMPMMLKGPTGCGKSRFVEYMAHRLNKPLITVACNEDMTASDLVGRFLLDKDGTQWQDGPLTTAARIGAICYLDEVVEARQDTTVVIHPLTDHRRTLPLDKKGELIEAHPDFQLVISYNPGYQSLMKDLKQSTKQRFGGLDFNYPELEKEIQIVARESGIDSVTAEKLVQIAHRARNLKGHGLDEGISTRLLVYAGQLIGKGVDADDACLITMVTPLTDDPDMRDTLTAAVQTFFS